MPYGTVNLRYGVPPGETTVTCTAGVGTYILEFATLSRLTGDPVYEEVAMHALRVMYDHRSPIGLFGNHIDVKTGKWVARDSGIGAGVDSFFEYLVKGSILLNRPELMAMFNEARKPIDKYLKKNNWYIWASMHKGQVTLPVFQSLEAYWPGVLTLIGDVETALRSMHNYNSVWKQYGFTPEFYNIPQGQAGTNRESYPLRPELVESAMYLYRATGDPFMLDIGKNILRSIQHSAKTPCGYATIKDSRDHSQENRMESFFLAETTKYLYLLFDPDNFIHNRGSHGRVHTLSSGKQCVLDSGAYIFNTEAHPIDASALNCCNDWKQESYNPYTSFNFKGDIISEANSRHPKTDREEPPEMDDELIIDVEDQQEIIDIPGVTAETSETEGTSMAPSYDEHTQDQDDPDHPETGDGEADEIQDKHDEGININEDAEGGKVIEAIDKLNSPPSYPSNEAIIDALNKKLEESTKDSADDETGAVNVTQQKEHMNELLKIVDNNRQKLLDFIDKLSKIDKDLAESVSSDRPASVNVSQEQDIMGKDDEPTFSPNEEPKIENTSFDHISSDGAEGSIVTKNRVGEHFLETREDTTDLMSLTEYVKTLVVSPPPPKNKFDAQKLLESVRYATARRALNHSWTDRYDYLTCKAQPFLIRITIAGEFMDEK
uniref:alpha-1,2-Mannosidase n=1 Tax=Lygus hesperus TaxID=30085 RepID=A0A0K8TE01_LYGHE